MVRYGYRIRVDWGFGVTFGTMCTQSTRKPESTQENGVVAPARRPGAAYSLPEAEHHDR